MHQLETTASRNARSKRISPGGKTLALAGRERTTWTGNPGNARDRKI
jgi:hypothetical protein